MYEKLLEGSYDLHVHTGPDLSPRKLNDFEYAERLNQLGMKGFAIKSHYFCTAERAQLTNIQYPNMNVLGGITLNNSVGGFNPFAVEMAIKAGSKIIWMPTLDAENELDYLLNSAGYQKVPPWAKIQLERKEQGRPLSTLTIFKDAQIDTNVKEIIKLAADNDVILATAHLGKKEIFPLVKLAREMGVEKVLITHPTFPSVDLSKEEQKELVDLGAYIEQCFSVIKPKFNMTWDELYEQIRYVDYRKVILSSDLGQVDNIYPDEAMVEFVQNLYNNGFSNEEISIMTVLNTNYLVEG